MLQQCFHWTGVKNSSRISVTYWKNSSIVLKCGLVRGLISSLLFIRSGQDQVSCLKFSVYFIVLIVHFAVLSLSEVFAKIDRKAPRVARPSEVGSMQDLAVAQRLLLHGRSYKSNDVQSQILKNIASGRTNFCKDLVDCLRSGDGDGDDLLLGRVVDKLEEFGDTSNRTVMATVLAQGRSMDEVCLFTSTLHVVDCYPLG